MKIISTVLVASSIIMFGGCNKQHKAMINDGPNETREVSVEVEVDPDSKQLVLLINGEKTVIDLNDHDSLELLNEFDIALSQVEGMDDHMVRVVLEAQESDMMQHGRMMEMHGAPSPEMMQEMHGRMMEMHGDPSPEMMHEMHGEWVPLQQEMDRPEMHFIEEIGVLREVSHHLDSPEAVAMLGISMLRESLDTEARLEALEVIIHEAPQASAARNAALIATIETLRELEREEEAVEVVIELVLSNSVWDREDEVED